MKHYLESVKDVLKETDSRTSGLDSAEAERRLAQYGRGRLLQAKKESLFSRFADQLTDPMVLVLVAAAVISSITAALSGESFADVFIILSVVILNAVLGVIQESKAESAIEALKKMTASESTVLRDGAAVRIPSDEIVPGDIVILNAGDAVPADGRLIECKSLKVDESALTGESVPSEKTDSVIRTSAGRRSPRKRGREADSSTDDDIALGDRHNMVYMGSCVVYGRGAAVITETGMNTEMGKIAGAITGAEKTMTPLQIRLNKLSGVLTKLVLAICIFMFAFSLIQKYSTGEISGFDKAAVLHTFMLSVSLAVAAIPEGLAAVVTVVLSLGVTRMSKKNAVIRRLTAVETLGCTQVICSDKTGTLTKNKMTVVKSSGGDSDRLAAALALCSDAVIKDGEAVGDPTQCAVVNYAQSIGLEKEALEAEYPRLAEIPFDSERKMMTTVHSAPHGNIQYTTGAPDVIIARCGSCIRGGRVVPMSERMKQEALEENRRLAGMALRVIAAACREYREPVRQGAALSPKIENGMIYLGLVGMEDPIRDEVPDALQKCRSAGILTVMITGDHLDTAAAIAGKLGVITDRSQAITGAELDRLDDEQLSRRITDLRVYARVKPEHKTRIVNAWRRAGYVTAMTGDGVNDAPSLKSADIGIGMGVSGTDVVKNVADLILADDNFATITYAVAEGRRIYDNICKAVQFLLSSNLSEVISIFAATVLGFTILSPVQILWINLITDSLPALALGLEKAEPDLMQRQPRSTSEGIFDGGVGIEIALQGALVSLLTLSAYFIGGYMETGAFSLGESADGMTMAFLTMAMAEIFHSCNMRSRHSSIFRLHTGNPALFGAVLASLALTACVIFVRPAAMLFGFEPISMYEYIISLGLAAAVIPFVEIGKLIRRIILRKKSPVIKTDKRRYRTGNGNEAVV